MDVFFGYRGTKKEPYKIRLHTSTIKYLIKDILKYAPSKLSFQKNKFDCLFDCLSDFEKIKNPGTPNFTRFPRLSRNRG